jgi:hypothetical protein
MEAQSDAASDDEDDNSNKSVSSSLHLLQLGTSLTDDSFDNTSVDLLNPVLSADDHESLALLKQIFPTSTTDELRRLHQQRLLRSSTAALRRHGRGGDDNDEVLAAPFTSLRSSVDVRQLSPSDGFVDERVAAMDRQMRSRMDYEPPHALRTVVLHRPPGRSSLGLTLTADPPPHQHVIRVYARSAAASESGPAPGDIVVGCQGRAWSDDDAPAGTSRLRHAVERLRQAATPVVLHYLPQQAYESSPFSSTTTPSSTPALLDVTIRDESMDESVLSEEVFFVSPTYHSTPPAIVANPAVLSHAVVATLQARGLIATASQVAHTNALWAQYTERTRLWETRSCLHVHHDSPRTKHNGHTNRAPVILPLVGIRPALCVRIVHSFISDEEGTSPTSTTESSYTIGVYDVSTGHAFYAPVRSRGDFDDLYRAVGRLDAPCIKRMDFPKRSQRTLFGSPVRETASVRERATRQLEGFLRSLCGLLYQSSRLSEFTAEIALHVQSFLGCDHMDFMEAAATAAPATSSSEDRWIRGRLKRSLQRYTYRLLLLPPLQAKVQQFVEVMRGREPVLQDMEALQAQGPQRLKQGALAELAQVKAFLDYLQELIMDAGQSDFASISQRDEYRALRPFLQGSQGEIYWDGLVREAVREQVEIEVYVPLRSLLSRFLVNGWRHEDMEANFKIKELRQRPQDFFRIPGSSSRPADWLTACQILRQGVGMSTLPCVKLRAIVDAAKEISRIFAHAKDSKAQAPSGMSSEATHLGADQFLPIFIFCVVQAEIDRPCALCVLLRSLCDRINQMGEIGYYLASFEAAVTHIQEIDLSEDAGSPMQSFLSVNLDTA